MAQRPLYLMAKLPPEILAAVWALPRTDKSRRPNSFHITLLQLPDLNDVPEKFLPFLIRLLDGFIGSAFDLELDRIVEGRFVGLWSSRPTQGARALQTSLTDYLTAQNFPYFGAAPEAHVTIKYRWDGAGNERIRPIAWTVDRIVLVESVKGRHIPHGSWPLHTRID